MLYLQHLSISAYAMVSLMKSLTVKGFGIVNDRTDTYLIGFLNVQSCRLQLEPSLDTMAPKMVSLVMQTLHKSTLDEASIIIEACKTFLLLSRHALPCNITYNACKKRCACMHTLT